MSFLTVEVYVRIEQHPLSFLLLTISDQAFHHLMLIGMFTVELVRWSQKRQTPLLIRLFPKFSDSTLRTKIFQLYSSTPKFQTKYTIRL